MLCCYVAYCSTILFLLFFTSSRKPLNRDHGYPLRVVIPGVIGARSVKWLDSISMIAEESQVGNVFDFFHSRNCLPS